MANKGANEDGAIIVKKYANRRLYNTQTSSYITLDTLAEMTRNDVDFVVIDAKTGDDITHGVLTQIIVEEEASGQNMLPVKFLRQIISMYGNSMQTLMPSYLEAAMENFRTNQRQFQETIETALSRNPIGKMAVENQKRMEEAVENIWKSSPLGSMVEKAKAPPVNVRVNKKRGGKPAATSGGDTEIEELKAQLAAMQDRLDQLDN